ncbi:hypothetical protein [Sphingomonas desiccabilis]|uniref:Uncharacterized protein n=1 Tax=Sphingomonas desiccabilis TaxID=429134 RepID=A0A4Q2IYL9_9SPHN|nr:hypothetical protein [Sphingomonas desiccabilis]MBB3909727.1 hypothetical protein [Sphingomonas desiccabilis]RXZ34420.1 hypothetical protein EO081_01640 [Sphingomonas desiccabilis]
MLIIDSTAAMASALDQPLDEHLMMLLTTRRDQLNGSDDLGETARFLVVEPRDSLAEVEAAIGFPLVTDIADGICLDDPDTVPSWEWAEHHEGGWIELAFIFSDDGAADVLLVNDREGGDPDLIDLLRHHLALDHEQTGSLVP